jgi:hypothetical protein
MDLFSQHITEGNLRQVETWGRIQDSLCDITITCIDSLSKIRTYGNLGMMEADVVILLEKTSHEVAYLDLLPETLRVLKLRAGGQSKACIGSTTANFGRISEPLKARCPELRNIVLTYDRVWWGSYTDADIQT